MRDKQNLRSFYKTTMSLNLFQFLKKQSVHITNSFLFLTKLVLP